MTPRKPIAIILAVLFGWTGVHRLYLGHPIRGLFFLLYPIVFLTTLFSITGTLDIARDNASLDINNTTLPFILPILLLPFLDGLWLATRSDAYFARQKSLRLTHLLAVVGIAVLVNAGIYRYVWQTTSRSADGVTDRVTTVDAFTDAYLTNYISFDGQIIELTGKLTEEEILLREDADPIRTLIMGEGKIPVQLIFSTNHQAIADTLSIERTITVKGICRADFEMRTRLEDCRLVE